jgi:hypothetical protein
MELGLDDGGGGRWIHVYGSEKETLAKLSK